LPPTKNNTKQDGKLSVSEAVDLLNSKDLSAAIEKLTGMPHTHRTEADIKKWFSRADFDKRWVRQAPRLCFGFCFGFYFKRGNGPAFGSSCGPRLKRAARNAALIILPAPKRAAHIYHLAPTAMHGAHRPHHATTRATNPRSGTLSKREFTVMYVGLLADKAKVGAGGMAQAICTALDRDGDGMIGSTEFKKLIEVGGLTGFDRGLTAQNT
jgi:hypothetical protein